MWRAKPSAGRRGARWFLAFTLIVAVACTSAPPKVVPGPGGSAADRAARSGDLTMLDPTSSHTADSPGVSLLSVFSKPVFVFGHPVPISEVQPASTLLTGAAGATTRLTVTPLPSPPGTAAVHVLEVSRTKDRWGTLSTPAQRRIYATFAEDGELGKFLVLVSDVRVVDGLDPIPVTAYRWPREAVEAYATCGIPAPGIGVPWEQIDDCTQEFFVASETKMVLPGARTSGI